VSTCHRFTPPGTWTRPRSRASSVVFILTGVGRTDDDEDFAWHGDARTDSDAFDAIATSWARWAWWAGLEPIAPLQRGG
jgi:hypothetical protein